ncbi:MAG: lysylphosphatidylglycerol synthase domain-containing protein [Candidatus Micrarchaeia archaeon]
MPFFAKLGWKQVKPFVYLAVAVLVAFALYKVLGAEDAIGKADLGILALSQLLFFASAAFWNNAWAKRAGIGARDAVLAGFSSMAGMLTPMGVGSDFLRTFFGKHLHKDASYLLATSLAVKIYKVVIAALLVLAFLPTVFSGGFDPRLRYSLAVAGLLMLAAALIIASIGRRGYPAFLGKFFAVLGGNGAVSFAGHFKSLFAIPPKAVLLHLTLSLLFEFLAFYAVFFAFHLTIAWEQALAVFLLLFLASKALLPNGFGVVETLGLFLFQGGFETSVAAAVLLAWDAVRAWVPALASALFVSARRWIKI